MSTLVYDHHVCLKETKLHVGRFKKNKKLLGVSALEKASISGLKCHRPMISSVRTGWCGTSSRWILRSLGPFKGRVFDHVGQYSQKTVSRIYRPMRTASDRKRSSACVAKRAAKVVNLRLRVAVSTLKAREYFGLFTSITRGSHPASNWQ